MIEARISSLSNHVSEEVEIKGWLVRARSSGKIHFLQLRDGSGFVQGILELNESNHELFEKAKRLKMETSIILRGLVKEDKRAPGGVELKITGMDIVQIPEKDFPINKPDHGIDYLMENRHLWIRTRRQADILRVRHEVLKAAREFYEKERFILIDTPIITGSIGESAGNCFEIDYFDYGKAYLAQTGQLYLEAACMSLGNVYNLGPTFRAEKSKTRRHLIEFWMNEAEMAYYSHDDNIRLQEKLVSFIVRSVVERCSEDLVSLGRDISKLRKVEPPFPRITYEEALSFLNKKGIEMSWGDDLGGDEETVLAGGFEKPLVVERYPARSKAFYMQPDPNDERVVLCNDMLAPEGYGEIIGASERINDRGTLIDRITDFGLNPEDYRWYIELREFGTVQHSGFGMGIERLVSWICGLEHVREAIPFARTLYRIYP